MINAYILIHTSPGNTEKILAEIKKIENIVKISVVAGEFDIVARVQVKSLNRLLKATDKIQMVKGVNKTTPQVIEKEITL